MARPSSTVLTNSERAVMEVLWRKKEASVHDAVDELSETKSLAYTTVLTMFRILEKKGFVTHRKEGRAFIYLPTVSRAEARKQALESLLRQFFGGSTNVLAQHLISEHDIDLDELKALEGRVANLSDEDDQP